jgi:hypothetical protein
MWKDNRGTLLEVDQKVAYNYSGEIAVGKITRIRTVEKQYWNGPRKFPRIYIEQLKPQLRDKESIVTSDKNVLVLMEE